MQYITYKTDSDAVTVYLYGQVDSGNAAVIEAEIAQALDASGRKDLVIDVSKLSNISSSGLRMLQRLAEAEDDMSIVGASDELYDLFLMTHLTEEIRIKKTMQSFSPAPGSEVSRGANGRVYRADGDTFVKVYTAPDALAEIERERELAGTLIELGIPTAVPDEVVGVEGGGYGSVFRLKGAQSFAELLLKGSRTVEEIAQMSVDLLRIIHSTLVLPDSMPSMKSIAEDWALFLRDYLPADQADKLYTLISGIPEDYHMLHGDYHIKHIMQLSGESLIMDMDTLAHGHPVFELAGMFNAYCGYCETDHAASLDFIGVPYGTAVELWERCLRLYLGGIEETRVREIENKVKILGYARIMRRTIRRDGLNNAQGQRIIENCRAQLASLLPATDSLSFNTMYVAG